MSLVSRFIEQLKQRGLSIAPGTQRGVLLLQGPNSERTPEVMRALKAFKPELLKIYQPEPGAEPEREKPPPASEPAPEECRVCGADVSDPETRERLVDPAFCDRAGSKAVIGKAGTVQHEATERCPYKPKV